MDAEESSIEKLKRALYSRDERVVPKEKRSSVQGQEIDVATNWGTNASFGLSPDELVNRRDMARKNPFFSKFLIVSIVFFLIAVGVTAFVFLGGVNMISSNNVDMKIVAPGSVASGEELDIGLSIINQNRSDLQNAVLTVDYPSGTRAVGANGETGDTLTREKIDIGTLAKGSSKNQTLRMILFGEKEAVRTVTMTLEYSLSGSNATFTKQKTYDVTIGSSPLLLLVDYPKEINSGQDVTFSISVTSNSAVPVKDILVKTEYPYGFTYKSSNIPPVSQGSSVWNIGDLQNGDKRTLVLTGTLVGQDMEDRSFIFSVGTKSENSSQNFETSLAVADATVGIRKSFFNLGLSSTMDNLISIGQQSSISINWQNTLAEKVANASLEAKISGNVFEPADVMVGDGGFYRSFDKTIIWDKNTTGDLASLSPGQSGQVTFSVGTIRNEVQARSIKNPHIDIHVTMSGNRTGPDAERITSSEDITLKIPTRVSLLTRSFRKIGPFTNTGPIPPATEKESTYTVTWTLTNTVNDVKDAVLSASIPAGAEWKGVSSPSSERITYNPDTRTITWNAGSISSGTGYTSSPREVSFQIGVTPSLNQEGESLALTSGVSFEATDTYTGKKIGFTNPGATTLFSDPDFRLGQEKVVR